MLEATVIRARPADVLKMQPFMPKKEPAKATGELSATVGGAVLYLQRYCDMAFNS